MSSDDGPRPSTSSSETGPAEEAHLPAGFIPSERSSPLLDLIGPIATADRDGAVIIGLRASRRHCNSRGLVHGAVVSALADVVMGRTAALAREPRPSLVTVTLNVDFIAPIPIGAWMEASAVARRVGRRLAFVQGLVHADGTLVAQTAGTFAVA